jgi:hypothetical protein
MKRRSAQGSASDELAGQAAAGGSRHLARHQADGEAGAHDAQRGLEVGHDHAVVHGAPMLRGVPLQHHLHRAVHRQAHVLVVQRLLEARDLRARERMVRPAPPRTACRCGTGATAGADIGASQHTPSDAMPLAHAAHDLRADALLQVDLDAAVRRLVQEGRDVVGQRLGHGRHRSQDAHLAAAAAA